MNNPFYEVTTYDHKPKYIMREAATISEWARCLEDIKRDDKRSHPNWVKQQYDSVDRELGFMRNGYFYKPLFSFDDDAKEYQAIIDYDEPTKEKLNKSIFLAWDKHIAHNRRLLIAGFVSSETRTVLRRAPTR